MNVGKREKGIDVIIPIYNAYEDLKLCIESIKKHVDFSIDRVLLIDDCSSDNRIKSYIGGIAQTSGFVVIFNDNNLGFSGSVNKGITYSDRDVILLNSDTIVTSNWIDKIYQCAYSAANIGTVTPLSNSATICSIPNFCQDNTIPDNFTIDSYAEVVEKCSFQQYPEISVAVGFCMFIKREVINAVGLFDAETYQRGYGEENDFCWLASQLGYIHVLCDDTFIYHKGTISFQTEEKRKLIAAHENILKKRYPLLMRENEVFCSKDKNWHIRKNIGLYAKLDPSKSNLLYFLHLDFHKDCSQRVGGTQFHVEDLVKGLVSDFNIFVVARDEEYLRLTLYTESGQETSLFYIAKVKPYTVFRDRRIEKILENIISAFKIQLIHVHHTQGMSLDIFNVAHAHNIPLVSTLHDYYTICPTIKMLDYNGNICIGRDNNLKCKECLWKQCKISKKNSEYIKLWRGIHKNVLMLCDIIFVPSKAAKKIILLYYPELESKMQVVEHGLNTIEGCVEKKRRLHYTNKINYHFEHIPNLKKGIYRIEGWAYLEDFESRNSKIYIYITDSNKNVKYLPAYKIERLDVAKNGNQYLYSGFYVEIPQKELAIGMVKIQVVIENSGIHWTDGNMIRIHNTIIPKKSRLNVAFVGGMSPAKGSRIAYNLIKHSKKDITWYIMGGIGDKDLEALQQENLIKIGWYEREQLTDLMKFYNIDLVCILPTWAETFCYTLSESWLCNIPVIASDLGAVGERVKKVGGGWIVNGNSSYEEILKIIESLDRDSEQYLKMKERISHINIRPLEEMADDYYTFYEMLLVGNKPTYDSISIEERQELFKGFFLAYKEK